MRIVINETPPSINKYLGRSNVWEYRQDKAYWTNLVYTMALYAKPVNYTPPKKANVIITYYFKTKARHDPDNFGKLILDGMVKAGVIMDDCFDHINLTLKGGWDKENPRTEIEIGEKMTYEERWMKLKEFLQEEYTFLESETTTDSYDRRYTLGKRAAYMYAIVEMDELEGEE